MLNPSDCGINEMQSVLQNNVICIRQQTDHGRWKIYCNYKACLNVEAFFNVTGIIIPLGVGPCNPSITEDKCTQWLSDMITICCLSCTLDMKLYSLLVGRGLYRLLLNSLIVSIIRISLKYTVGLVLFFFFIARFGKPWKMKALQVVAEYIC